MPEIVLTTLNARYIHAAFGLRYLMANLPDALRDRATILEFEASQRTTDMIERILAESPRIVGVGVYIWNAVASLQFVSELKRLRPDITVIVGGPEVSHETEKQEIARVADYVITGEADVAFGVLCEQLLTGTRPLLKKIDATLPEFAITNKSPPMAIGGRPLVLPYDLYTDEDLRQRVVYVEASRGCPFSCEFCLSSLDVPVRNVPTDAFLAAMQSLFDRGCRQFKFVDRTFNLNLPIARAILKFFLDRYEPGLFVHFEMVPDRLPEGLRELIRQFPAGALQFEVGIQTFDVEVEARISRRQNHERLDDNLRWLRGETGVHVHADLIAGLPGETLETFGRGFDRLVGLGPQEIQVGILKRLRGTPIVRHDAEFGMVYSPTPPYEVLATSAMPFETLQFVRRFSRFWDLVANSGSFVETLRLVMGDSPFAGFSDLTRWLTEKGGGQTHGIALHKLAERLFEFLVSRGTDPTTAADAIVRDFNWTQRDAPAAILARATVRPELRSRRERVAPARQQRHLVRAMNEPDGN